MKHAPAYVIISLVFFILTGMALGYSCFFYPNRHPLACAAKKVTGRDCPSCGLSRSFSHYTRLEFREGQALNPRSAGIFLFFVFQFLLRGGIITSYLIRQRSPGRGFLAADLAASISAFLLAFLPLFIKL